MDTAFLGASPWDDASWASSLVETEHRKACHSSVAVVVEAAAKDADDDRTFGAAEGRDGLAS